MMQCKKLRAARESAKGFSLVELMVAMVLGLIVVVGASSVYLTSKRSLTETEQIAALSENGRFALQLISDSVRLAGFYGGIEPDTITWPSAIGVDDACTGGAKAYDTENSIFAVRAESATVLGCITDAVIGTDVLVIKGVDPSPLSDADPEDPSAPRDGIISFPAGAWSNQKAYVVTHIVGDNREGRLVALAATPPAVDFAAKFPRGTAWPYRLHVYYIRQGVVPTLSRKILAWDKAKGKLSMQTQDLVPGVENIRFLFGYDTGDDHTVYTTGNLEEVDGADAWADVISLQAFILLRSVDDDKNYKSTKTYEMGDIAIGPKEPPDGFRRILLHSDIVMRNLKLDKSRDRNAG